MANIAIYDPNSTPQKVLQYLESVNTPDYSSRPDVIVNPNVSSLLSIPIKYWKHLNGSIVEMTSLEKAGVDNAIVSDFILSMRNSGKDQIDFQGGQGIVLRAFADIIKDEFNILRGWMESFKEQVSLSTSLADLKSRVSGLPSTPDRTLDQLRTAIKNRIDAGSVDN